MNLKNWISENLIDELGRVNVGIPFENWFMKTGHEEKWNTIHTMTAFLKDGVSFRERIYCILNDIVDQPKCKICNSPVNFFNGKYTQYCSLKCSSNDVSKKHKRVEKSRATCLKRYGVDNPLKNEVIKNKVMTTNLNKWGVVCTRQNELVKEKSKLTCLEKYGTEHPMKCAKIKEKVRSTKLKKYNQSGVINHDSSSAGEKELLLFLNSFGFVFTKNRSLLSNLELDAYCDELKLAVEYCGLYWHCELHKDKNYHYDKMKRCMEKSVRLITIFEDEWRNKQIQVKQFLSATIGIFSRRIGASKCKLVCLHKPYTFFQENHIQGSPNNIKYAYGLIYDDELVGAVSFALHHRNNKQIVLNRLAFKHDVQIIGGATKLISNALTHFDEDIITWSDNRWSYGEIYHKCGFEFNGAIRPDYSYITKAGDRYSKQSMQKKNIGCLQEITEHEFCFANGLYRIYDCGKKRWSFRKE